MGRSGAVVDDLPIVDTFSDASRLGRPHVSIEDELDMLLGRGPQQTPQSTRALTVVDAPDANSPAMRAKHAADRVLAAVAILILAPVLLLVALLVKATSSGPVLYRQRRVGRHGECFDILKFRSMRVDGGTDGFRPASGRAPGGVEGDDRRTPVGRLLRRTSIDELPQLFNVVRGEMSLVGPRPERPEFVQLFADEVPGYAERHSVRVGITGLAQVRGLRGKTSIASRAAADNEYIANWSLLMDVKVLALTARAVVRAAE